MADEVDPRLLRGIEEFNRGLFFECHETLEDLWLEDRGDDHLFYQGLIQIAAGYLKWQQGVLAGAVKLIRAGLEKLEQYPPRHLGVHIGPFKAEAKEDLSRIEKAHGARQDLPFDHAPTLLMDA